jgi:hypothetical protein
MSNNPNHFEHTSPGLSAPSDTVMQTSDQEGLTQQAERVRAKKNASRNVRNLIIGVVVIAIVAFFAIRLMSGKPQPTTSMKPIEPLPPLTAVQPVLPAEPIKLPDAPQQLTQGQLALPATVVAGAALPANGTSAPSMTPVSPVMPAQTSQPVETSKFVKIDDHELLMGRVKVLEERTGGWNTEFEGLKMLEGRVKKLEDGKGTLNQYKKQTMSSQNQNASKAGVPHAVVKPAVSSGMQDVRPGFWIEGSAPKGNVGIDGSTRDKAKASLLTTSSSASSSNNIPTEVVEATASGKKGGDTLVVGNRRAEVVPYQLIAIVQDRAWVKLSDGSMKTVQRGEKLPNGDTVLLIDDKKDEVKTSGGLLR